MMSRGGAGVLKARKWTAALIVAAVAAVLSIGAAPAAADFGIKAFDGQVTADEGGTPYTQAGGHPFEAWSVIAFNRHPDPALFGLDVPDADVRTIEVDLPPGLSGNPLAVPSCSRVDFFSTSFGGGTDCPVATQIGVTYIDLIEGLRIPSAVWNLTPSPGSPATFGFQISGIRVLANASVRTGDDYGITLTFPNINQGLQILDTRFTLWGLPADSTHDALRCSEPSGFSVPMECIGEPGDPRNGPNSVLTSNPQPFLTNPTACTPAGVGLVTDLAATSWQDPGTVANASFESHLPPAFPAPVESWGPPQGPTGCESVPFEPSITATPTSTEAGAPTGLDVALTLPQDGLNDPGGLATGHLKRATVTLPAGMSINPALAAGLSGCTVAQIDLDGPATPTCPESSKIGTASIATPLLEGELQGSIYLATQGTNPFNSLLAVYMVAEDQERGVSVKVAGRVTPDPATGQLVAVFDDNPQLPFDSLHLRFNGGDRAPLVNPSSCGVHTSHAELESWSRPGAPVASDSSFSVTGNCARGGQFTPALEAGVTNPVAGKASPFTLRVTRPDGQQNISTIGATLPQGLLAKLKGVATCPEPLAASGDCPAASQIGTTTVAAGSGGSPVVVPEPGRTPTAVYLAGPYKGAPLSLVVKVPAQAGPFDLGTVAVRSSLSVDPVTTQVTALSDPLPQILQGFPISYRDVRIELNRPGFTVNPTSCEPLAVRGRLGSAQGTLSEVSDRFQVGDCASLGFKPKLALRFFGKTHRSAYPRLRATLTMPGGNANVSKTVVTMPKTELLEQGHIRTICTRDQWASDSCPKGSIYGKAKAFTPLLDKPLEGNVYLRSNGGARELPDLVADLRGQIDIELVGYIDAVNARLRARFLNVPDAPVSKFVLDMQGGQKGLLAHNTDVCKTKPRANVKFDGQNGKVHDFNPVVKTDCGTKQK
jgi:hypothetical protein